MSDGDGTNQRVHDFIERVRRSEFGAVHLAPLLAYCIVYTLWSFTMSFQIGLVDSLYQSLGTQALEAQPVESLLANHVQPPGLNAVYSAALHLPFTGQILRVLFFVAGLGTVMLVADQLRRLGASRRTSRTTALIYA